MAAQISPSLVVYKTAAGYDVPAVLLVAYDTNGAAVTDISDTVTADIVTIGTASGQGTSLSGVTKGTTAGTFAYLTTYSA